jgi:Anti-sigma-28 factor, FlgM
MGPSDPALNSSQAAQNSWYRPRGNGNFAVLTVVFSADRYGRIRELRRLIHTGSYRVSADRLATCLIAQMLS